jgi:thioredoxin reductase
MSNPEPGAVPVRTPDGAFPAFDVIIAGGGPAGLQAALVLARARRRVLLCDTGEPRNSVTGVMHGFISRDGVDPAELRRIATEELRRYPTVELREVAITKARAENGRFAVSLPDGAGATGIRLILATGVIDQLPAIPGLEALWGTAAFHCAYCDAFELRDQPLAVIESGATAGFEALGLGDWSGDLVLCTDGGPQLPGEDRAHLAAAAVAVRTEPIARVEPDRDGVRIVFNDGAPLERRAVFTHPPTSQRSDLAAQLGCHALEDGSIEVNDFGQTSVPGVYAAGDMARRATMPFPAAQAIHAASAGGIAAVVAHRELIWAEIETRGGQPAAA